MHPILDNPETIARIRAAARRERTREINRLVFAPIAAFFHRPAKTKAKAAAALTVACS